MSQRYHREAAWVRLVELMIFGILAAVAIWPIINVAGLMMTQLIGGA